MPEKTMKIAGDCVRIATSIIEPTMVGWNCKPLNRRVARSGGSCANPCCFMKFITADRAMVVSFYVLSPNLSSPSSPWPAAPFLQVRERCHPERRRREGPAFPQVLRSRAFRALAQDDTPPCALKKEKDGTHSGCRDSRTQRRAKSSQ